MDKFPHKNWDEEILNFHNLYNLKMMILYIPYKVADISCRCDLDCLLIYFNFIVNIFIYNYFYYPKIQADIQKGKWLNSEKVRVDKRYMN